MVLYLEKKGRVYCLLQHFTDSFKVCVWTSENSRCLDLSDTHQFSVSNISINNYTHKYPLDSQVNLLQQPDREDSLRRGEWLKPSVQYGDWSCRESGVTWLSSHPNISAPDLPPAVTFCFWKMSGLSNNPFRRGDIMHQMWHRRTN